MHIAQLFRSSFNAATAVCNPVLFSVLWVVVSRSRLVVTYSYSRRRPRGIILPERQPWPGLESKERVTWRRWLLGISHFGTALEQPQDRSAVCPFVHYCARLSVCGRLHFHLGLLWVHISAA